MQVLSLAVGLMGANCHLIWNEEKEAAVVDPGDESERIIGALEENGLSVGAILLTHGHFDHIGGVAALKEKYGAPVIIGGGDEEMLEDGRKNLSAQFGRSVTSVPADRVVMDSDRIQAGGMLFEVLATPGHSAGSVCYRCGDLLFTGDTLFAGSIGRTDLPGGDYRAMETSLRTLASLEGDAVVYPGHGPQTTLENERKANPFLESLT